MLASVINLVLDVSIGLWPAWHSCRVDFVVIGRELKPHLGDVSFRLISDLWPLYRTLFRAQRSSQFNQILETVKTNVLSSEECKEK